MVAGKAMLVPGYGIRRGRMGVFPETRQNARGQNGLTWQQRDMSRETRLIWPWGDNERSRPIDGSTAAEVWNIPAKGGFSHLGKFTFTSEK